MPVIKYPTADMFELAPYADFMVNPVNLLGAMGRGISAEFCSRHPALHDKFMDAVNAKKLGIGQIQVIKDPKTNYRVINMVTKNHFADANRKEFIVKGLESIRRYLKRPENKFATLVIPILATDGENGYSEMAQEFHDMFDDLDAAICLCMHPDKIGYFPKYLAVMGPKGWADKDMLKSGKITPDVYASQYSFVEDGVMDALKYWDLKQDKFDAIVSGGDPGVMTAVAGRIRGDEYDVASIAAKRFENKKVVVPADVERKGVVAARASRDLLIFHLATHVVVILPPDMPAIETYQFLKAVRLNNMKHLVGSREHKFLFVHGAETAPKPRITF